VTAPEQVSEWMRRFGAERIVLGLDVRLDEAGEARITTHGWTEASTLTLSEAIDGYRSAGLKHVLCTDVARDGALTGPNIELYTGAQKSHPDIAFQASGGIREADDLYRLAESGVSAAISGKALLEQRIRFEEIAPFLPNA
ncbi:MAG: 1-(5-phosphoribosyl)-5-[(5-phosphoribosylamino)methylideneamino]imidazole-4-carboxamide isomerase, partial [Gammaproteobacteria bacterium]